MPLFVIAAFRPKPGKEAALRDVLRDHMPTLRAEDLITKRPAYVMKAPDGVYLEIFEWKSVEAIDEAHRNPEVLKLWERFEDACEYVAPASVAGFDGVFPNFEPVELD